MNLSVVIPSRTLTNLRACVAAVKVNEPEANIIVVWDRSRGNSVAMPGNGMGEVIPVDEDFIFARNSNIGMRAAPAHHDIVLLNDDALLQTYGGLSLMVIEAENNRDIGVLGAVTNVTGQALQQPHGLGLREVPFFAFICVLIPRRTINMVGLLDERYCRDYGVEDNDYCEMVKRAGLRCAVTDHCYVDHASLRSTYRGDPHAYRSFAQNQQLFCEKWRITS